jgi:hypothetical protein
MWTFPTNSLPDDPLSIHSALFDTPSRPVYTRIDCRTLLLICTPSSSK